jgi:hypothetical protein
VKKADMAAPRNKQAELDHLQREYNDLKSAADPGEVSGQMVKSISSKTDPFFEENNPWISSGGEKDGCPCSIM